MSNLWLCGLDPENFRDGQKAGIFELFLNQLFYKNNYNYLLDLWEEF